MQALEKEVVRLEAQAQARGEAGSNVLKSVLAMDGVVWYNHAARPGPSRVCPCA